MAGWVDPLPTLGVEEQEASDRVCLLRWGSGPHRLDDGRRMTGMCGCCQRWFCRGLRYSDTAELRRISEEIPYDWSP